MALPGPDHPCWQKLASGGAARLRTQHLGMQLMIKRLERSGDAVAAKAEEYRAFFAKWEQTLAEEIQQLYRL